MADLLDADWFRASAFAAASLTMVWAWRHESRRSGRVDDHAQRVVWPIFWLMVGAVYASMAVALGVGLSGRLGGIGREFARSEQWYDSRRPLQAAVVVLVGSIWLFVVVAGIWRVPERRRRYLPSAIVCISLVCFAVIRLVSFHYVDAVLVRTTVVGVPSGTIVELVGIGVAAGLAAIAARRPAEVSASGDSISTDAATRSTT